MTRAIFTASLLALTLSVATPAGAVDITGCDQEIPAGEVGVLTTDLDCGPPTGGASYAVELEDNATLDLRGHTIRGSDYPVYCEKRCRVISTANGRGAIRGGHYGLWADHPKAKTRVSDVEFLENGTGIVSGNVTLLNVGFVDNTGGAVHLIGKRKLTAENVTVSGCNDSVLCIGIGYDPIRLTGFTLTGFTPTGTPTGWAVWGRTIRLQSGSISGAGVAVRDEARLRLKGIVLSGNGTDILSVRKPHLSDSTCETSQDFAATPWGVCSND